jgi:hypothetical protein
MSRIASGRSVDILEARLNNLLDNIARQHGVPFRGADPVMSFGFLVEDVSRAAGGQRIALLVDEYDAPVLAQTSQPAVIRDERLIAEARSLMRGFYSQIKASEQYLDFAFITGVSKFSRMGVFSSLNNIRDISLDPEYAAFMGYTHEELETVFAPYIARAARKFQITPEEMTEEIRRYYNGFSFDGETLVYNPFSTLGFFSETEFNNYWVESGSTSFIREFLRDRKLTVEQFRGLPVDRNFARMPGEIEQTPPEGFLYQSGYLTLRKAGPDDFTLDYPNFEVLSSLSAFFLENVLAGAGEDPGYAVNVRACLDGRDVAGLVEEFNRVFASVSYLDYVQAEKKKLGESFYRAMLHVFLNGAGVMTRPEEHNSLGRADMVATRRGRTLIIEMKTAPDAGAAAAAAAEGMRQMGERDYGNRYRNPILLSLAVDLENRRIGAWESAEREPRGEENPGDGKGEAYRPSF